MPKDDTFVSSLKNDLRNRKLTYDDAAEAASMSRRQFARYIRGETKQAMMPVEVLEHLRRKEIVSRDTAQRYVNSIRVRLRCKKATFRKAASRKEKKLQKAARKKPSIKI